MATYSDMVKASHVRRRKLMGSIQSHRKSIAELEKEVKALDAVIVSLGMLSKGAGAGPRSPGSEGRAKPKKKARKRGTWKPGSRGRPPQWYLDQKAGKKTAKEAGRKTAKKKARKTGKRKKPVSPKVLASLAKARAARAAKMGAKKAKRKATRKTKTPAKTAG